MINEINDFFLPVDETLSSSDELSDIKESGAKEVPSLVCCSKSSDVSENSKSLSDSDICYKTEVLTSDRCGSAPAEFLSDVTGSSDEKLVVDGSTSKSPSSNQSFSKINPPFIVYAAKKSESEPVPVSGESVYEPRESVKGKVVDENSQSPPQDKKNEQKNDVPQGSVRKIE